MDVPDMFCKLRFVGEFAAYPGVWGKRQTPRQTVIWNKGYKLHTPAGSVYKVVDKKAKV